MKTFLLVTITFNGIRILVTLAQFAENRFPIIPLDAQRGTMAIRAAIAFVFAIWAAWVYRGLM